MDWLVGTVQWLDVLLGMFWFGNLLVVATILIPTPNSFSVTVQCEVGGLYGERAVHIFDVVIPAVIVLGVVRGTLLAPIDSVDEVFSTAYGLTWLVALLVGLGLYGGASSSLIRVSGP